MAIALLPTRSAEYSLTHNDVEYTVAHAFEENGGAVFDVLLADSEEFVDSLWVSPMEDVADAFALWAKLAR